MRGINSRATKGKVTNKVASTIPGTAKIVSLVEEGTEVREGEVLCELLREFHQERAVYQAVSRHLELPRQSISERIVDAKFRGTIDRERDEARNARNAE